MAGIRIQYHTTPYAEFMLGSHDGKLCLLDYRYRRTRDRVDARLQRILRAEYLEKDSNVLRLARVQIDEYLAGRRLQFDLPFVMAGSAFQRRVWEALMKIPYGKTLTYQALAGRIGNVKAVRAVANANGANAMSLMIPCHRIIGSNGRLTGYAGRLETKQALLDLERRTVNDAHI